LTRLDDQRLAFGRVADLYNRARPSYPAAAIDDVIRLAGLVGGATILEVGAGTGKATVMFAERGLGVTALEPSAEMARLARANCAPFPGIEIVEAEFERWRPPERFPALVCAAAWHWLAADVRYTLAAEALESGGTLAAIWSFPDWDGCSMRGALSDAYRTSVPGLTTDFPMHPDSLPTSLAGDWDAEIRGTDGFADPTVRVYPWSLQYTSAGYATLLQTHQDHILLPDAERGALLAAVTDAIDAAGGVLRLRLVTRVCLATRR
jgi:SAM-dependent methyltransferase